MELRVTNMEEELQDLKTDKDSLERVSILHVFVLPSVTRQDRERALNIMVDKDNMLKDLLSLP